MAGPTDIPTDTPTVTTTGTATETPVSGENNPSTVTRFGMGASLTRNEDFKFLTGQGRYTDDVQEPGAVHAYFLRSYYAHAQFEIKDIEEAKSARGVHGVFIARDFPELQDLRCINFVKQPDGSPPDFRDIPPLCRDTVHHVGDAIAMVVADSPQLAKDAAELIDVEYTPLDAVVDTEQALSSDANCVAAEREDNLAYTHFIGEREQTDSIMQQAAHVVEIKITNNRLISNYMEPRACHAVWDKANDQFTVTVGSQGVYGVQAALNRLTGVDLEKIRVITGDVGGGFGTKVFTYREYPLVMLAARVLGRPVKWNSERSEHFLQDAHGRDNVTTARMAIDTEGRFQAIDVSVIAAMGAYLHAYGPYIPYLGVTMATGLYDIPVMACTTYGVYTNTVPTDAYRGAGRPEAAYVLERLVDKCAHEIGLPVDEIRRRNFIKSEQLPYTTPAGRTYDTGEFEGHMDLCMQRAAWSDFASRRESSREAGSLRGIGMATYVEACAFAGAEPAYLELLENGSATITIGTQSNGQGHATAYAQLASTELGMDYRDISIHQGDTQVLSTGGGTGGSRSVPLGGTSTVRAARALAANIRLVAAREFGCEPDQVTLEEGVARMQDSNAHMTLAEVAQVATDEERRASGVFEQEEATYPNGTHICEVEIDLETAVSRIIRYTIVDDFGVTVNPLLLEGQIHGGVVQSIGQCLLEHVVYSDDGQLLSGSLMDYALPRADDLPIIQFETRNVPSTTNELGMKGAGEAGTIGSCPAVMNALSDALYREFGNGDIDMPATPQKVFSRLTQLQNQG